jgi:arylsulfatase A-like enzyme
MHQVPVLALVALASATWLSVRAVQQPSAPARPNIVVILTDDQGYGDVSHLNPRGRIGTPHIDRLAHQGMTFTDAHSGSAVCTPTRYGLLTGRYAWRSRLQRGVLGGLSPMLIERGRMTLASLLRTRGYRTAAFGKWHLGLDWVVREGRDVSPLSIETSAQVWNVDYARPVSRGPRDAGFDEFFGIAGSLDMVPYAWIDDDRLSRVPTRDGDFAWFLGRDRRTRRGPTADGFDAADVLETLTDRAVDFLERRAPAALAGEAPFFLYLPYASPHTPILPSEAWRGRSGVNAYGDFVMQTDAAIGRVLAALDRLALTESTLVLFASDNGASPEADVAQLAAAGHHPSGPYRGHKADLFEGGHRVPFVVRWPGVVPAGRTYAHPVSLVDVLATVADALDVKLPADAAEDSVSLLPALRGVPGRPVRTTLVNHSIDGSFAIREGRWKLLLTPDSGGWSAPRPGSPEAAGLPALQLYDLGADPGERVNLAARHPERVRAMVATLTEQVRRGRSTAGPDQPNDAAVDVWNGRRTDAPLEPQAAGLDLPPTPPMASSDCANGSHVTRRASAAGSLGLPEACVS